MRAIDADAILNKVEKIQPWDAYLSKYAQGIRHCMELVSLLIQEAPTIEPEPSKQLKILASVLDGCPLTEACDKLFDCNYDWCRQHCKPGQDAADAECWMKYAEVMTGD